jgi:hypothetical protein
MTKWAYIENNEIKGVYDNLPKSWKNISGFNHLENDIELLKSHGWTLVDKSGISFDSERYSETGFTYSLNGDVVVATPILVEKSINNNNTYDLETIRMQRDELLKKTDVYQLVDWQSSFDEEMKFSWLLYRQKLRDATTNVYEFDFGLYQSELSILIDRSKLLFQEYIAKNVLDN